MQLPDEEAGGHLIAGYKSLLEDILREFDEEDDDCYMLNTATLLNYRTPQADVLQVLVTSYSVSLCSSDHISG